MKNNKHTRYLFPFSVIGFTAIIAQILFIREFMAVFYGNEIYIGIVIANWLLWTAAGSFIFGSISKRFTNIDLAMSFIQMLVGISAPVTLVLIRISKPLLQSVPGETLGLIEIYFTSFLVLSLFCLASGSLFSIGSYLIRQRFNSGLAPSTGFMYLVESLGSALGGLLISLLLIPNFTSMQISIFLALLNILSAIYLIIISKDIRKKNIITIAYLLILSFSMIGISELDSIAMKNLWKGLNVLENKNSKYGNITVVEEAGIKTFFENSVALYSIPDLESAEESVHYALLLHENPENILLVGGGIAGGIDEILKHRSIKQIDYIELDPVLIELAEKYTDKNWKSDQRVKVYLMDGRLFLKQIHKKYDVIIVNLPDPSTAQLNRFYTYEFFLSVFSRLKDNGLFSFQVSSSENYISEQLADYLRCINKTLKSVFMQTAYIPGNMVHFFASNKNDNFVINSDTLINRLHKRDITNQYISEYFIPFRLTGERVQNFKNIIAFGAYTPINKDFTPIAYYLFSVFWSTQFVPDVSHWFTLNQGIQLSSVLVASVIILLLIIIIFRFRYQSKQYSYFAIGFAVVSMGFSTIAFELLLIIAFQSLYGYVYHQLAIIIAAFMLGISLGSWWSLKKSRKNAFIMNQLTLIHLLTILFVLTLIAFLYVLNRIDNAMLNTWLSQIVFPLLTIIAGSFGGYQFVLASSLYFKDTVDKNQNIGFLYSLDLIGALIGGITLSTFLIPLFGFFKTAIITSVVNLLVVLSIILSLKYKNNKSMS